MAGYRFVNRYAGKMVRPDTLSSNPLGQDCIHSQLRACATSALGSHWLAFDLTGIGSQQA